MIAASALLAAGLAAPAFWLVQLTATKLGYHFETVAGELAPLVVIPGAALMGAVLHTILAATPSPRRVWEGAAWGMPLGLVNLFLSGLVMVALLHFGGGASLGMLTRAFIQDLPAAMIAGAPLALVCGLVLGAILGYASIRL